MQRRNRLQVPCRIGTNYLVGPLGMAGAADIYLLATLTFASMADIQHALLSPEGQATAEDLANFATAGVELFMFETKKG